MLPFLEKIHHLLGQTPESPEFCLHLRLDNNLITFFLIITWDSSADRASSAVRPKLSLSWKSSSSPSPDTKESRILSSSSSSSWQQLNNLVSDNNLKILPNATKHPPSQQLNWTEKSFLFSRETSIWFPDYFIWLFDLHVMGSGFRRQPRYQSKITHLWNDILIWNGGVKGNGIPEKQWSTWQSLGIKIWNSIWFF